MTKEDREGKLWQREDDESVSMWGKANRDGRPKCSRAFPPDPLFAEQGSATSMTHYVPGVLRTLAAAASRCLKEAGCSRAHLELIFCESESGGRECWRRVSALGTPIAADVDKANAFPNEMWTKFGEMGLLGVTVGENSLSARTWRPFPAAARHCVQSCVKGQCA
jgi:hypothetical protein